MAFQIKLVCGVKIALSSLLLCLLIAFFNHGKVFAQTDRDKKSLKKGIKLLDEGKFDKAEKIFNELAAPGSSVNAFTPEAEYLLALANLKQKKLDQARQILLATLQKENGADFKPEADYLLANIDFELGNNSKALATLSRLPSGFEQDVVNLKRYYLPLLPLDSLRLFFFRNNKDKVLAELLAIHLAGNPLLPADRALALQVAKLVGNPDLEVRINDLFKASKGVIKVALLLPLNAKQIRFKNGQRPNQFIIDLYAGFKLAASSLADSGIGVQLYLYDTEKSAETIQAVLQYPELKEMELIIGPVYSTGAAQVAQFSADNHIIMVNPLNNKLAWGAENEFAYLTEASPTTIAKKVANYAKDHLDISKTSIIYGTAVKDSILASEYRDQILAQGGKMALFRKIGKNSAANMIKFIKEAELDSCGHIFVPNSESLVNVQLMSALQILKYRQPVIAFDDWLLQGYHSLAQLERQNVHVIFPDFINQDLESVYNFNQLYTGRMNIMPSKFACIGYDILFYLCSLRSKNSGIEFYKAIRNSPFTTGQILAGYHYPNVSDNQVVPIYRITNGNLTKVAE